jgi:hypothetical protein
MIDPHFVILAAAISFLGGLSYLVDTLKGTAQPNRVSWFMWSLAPFVAFVAEVKQGVGLRSLMTFMAGFNPLLIFAATFIDRTSAWRVTRFDLCCGCLSLLGLCLWYVTGAGDVAIAAAIAADGLAAVPTLVKAYAAPQSESAVGFLAFATSAAITLLTISAWNFANYGFPLYICVMSLGLAALIRFRPARLFSQRYA